MCIRDRTGIVRKADAKMTEYGECKSGTVRALGPVSYTHLDVYKRQAENILYMLRRDGTFTEQEADLLDIMLMIHADHGGGNNSTFTNVVILSLIHI